MTSVLQPCDSGIIRSFKIFYKTILIKSFIRSLEVNGSIELPDIKTSLYYIIETWSKVSSETIENCWSHVDIIDNNNSVNCVKTYSSDNHMTTLETLINQLNNGQAVYTFIHYNSNFFVFLLKIRFIDNLEKNKPNRLKRLPRGSSYRDFTVS